MTDTYRTGTITYLPYLVYFCVPVTIVGEGYLTTISAQIFAYGDSE